MGEMGVCDRGTCSFRAAVLGCCFGLAACFASHRDAGASESTPGRERGEDGTTRVFADGRGSRGGAPVLLPDGVGPASAGRPIIDRYAPVPITPQAPDAEDDAGSEPTSTWSCGASEAPPEPAADTPFARNVVMLMNDGAGFEHYEAARAVAGGSLAVDSLVGPGRYMTYSLNMVTTDSAAGATAMATGQCTYNGAIGVDGQGRGLTSVTELARAAGKLVGIVTNTILIDASPMAFSTHALDRYCGDEFAQQLFDGARLDVVLGGFVPDGHFAGGLGLDERARDAGYLVGFELSELPGDDLAQPVLGLFGQGPSVPAWPVFEWGLTPEHLRGADSAEPTLAELTRYALHRLSRGSQGFFLFVENEHPDTVGHLGGSDPVLSAELMPHLMLELDAAIAETVEWVEENSSFEETLIVVGSDHETGGYMVDPERLSEASFAGSSHTSVSVPIFARGPGSENLQSVAHTSDIFLLLTGRSDALPHDVACAP